MPAVCDKLVCFYVINMNSATPTQYLKKTIKGDVPSTELLLRFVVVVKVITGRNALRWYPANTILFLNISIPLTSRSKVWLLRFLQIGKHCEIFQIIHQILKVLHFLTPGPTGCGVAPDLPQDYWIKYYKCLAIQNLQFTI